MVMVDFQNVPDEDPDAGGGSYPQLPDGQYKAFIEKVEEKHGEKGPYLNCTWVLTGGEFEGRKVWDKLFFTPKSLSRLKIVISKLGLPVDRPLDVTPELLTGKQAWITLEPHNYESKKTGRMIESNQILYGGFGEIGDGAMDNPGGDDDDMPI